MSVVPPRIFIKHACRLLVLIHVCSGVQWAQAQAGSRPPLQFDSPDAFYHSLPLAPGPGTGSAVMPAIVPEGVLQLPDSMRYLLWAELENGHLNVLERVGNEGLVLRKRIPMSIGKLGIDKRLEGDKKTPIGVYRLTSRLDDSRLDDFYGMGAYPLNYPNPRDVMLGRTGHGIWLHGLPKDTSERPLLDSDGCIVIDNASLLSLDENIEPGQTLIVMSPGPITWVAAHTRRETRDGLVATLEAWKLAWEARDNDRYLAFYADDFSDLRRGKAAWSDYKRRVNDSKRSIRVEYTDLSMLQDPLHQDLVTVRYFQNYRSDNYNWSGWKEQLWRSTDEGWLIVYEGNG